MLIFGRKKPKKTQLAASIRDIPNYSDAVKFLRDWFDHEVVVERVPGLIYYGNLEFEAAWNTDSKARIWMLLPSSMNDKANFDNFLRLPLNSLNAGVYNGTLVVGRRKTIVNRNYVDGFIHCMEEIYDYPWQKIRAIVNKSKVFPILLTTDAAD